MARPSFTEVWERIRSHEGRIFHTKRLIPFRYAIINDGFFPEGRNHRIDVSDFKNAYGNVPSDGPSDIGKSIREVRGASYIWAVLHDRRIRGADW
jgi:hypothetical protein